MEPTPDLPLRDIHLPDPVGWWPPAPLWWLLAALLAAAVAIGLWHYRRGRTRRAALRELAALRAQFAGHQDAACLLRDLSALMRRVALAHHPRAAVAGLCGDAWLDFLDRSGPGGFRHGPGRALADGPYRRAAAVDAAALLGACERWVRAQRRRAAP